MRKIINIKHTGIRIAFLIVIMISLLTGSCSSRKYNLDKKNLIPEKELVSLLTDLNIADGLFIIPDINYWFSASDSINTYNKVIEQHGYTKEILEKTMKYYFFSNPKKLNRIYDEVLGKLSEMETLIDKENIIESERISNLWPAKSYYAFPDHQGNDSSMFDITLSRPGSYVLKFSTTLFPDDQSVNPRPTICLSSPDSIDIGKKSYVKTVEYIKDGQPHNYRFTILVPEKKIIHVRGWLFDFDNSPFGFDRHILIDNISLTFGSMAVS